jgi:hypothetical protein
MVQPDFDAMGPARAPADGCDIDGLLGSKGSADCVVHLRRVS